MNIQHLFTAFVLLWLFTSCTIEDEFHDLTRYPSYLIQTTVYFEDGSRDYDVLITYYATDGLDNLVEKYYSYGGSPRDNREVFSEAVKDYKKAGLTISPGENATEVWINMYELGAGRDIFYQYHSEGNRPFTFMYNFETDSHVVTLE